MTYHARIQGSKNDLETLRYEAKPRNKGVLPLLKVIASIGRWIADPCSCR
jgi:hypothetical protein